MRVNAANKLEARPTDRSPGPNYSDEESEFLVAMETYRRESRRRFPTACEVLEILKSLGYRKAAEPGPLPKFKGEHP